MSKACFGVGSLRVTDVLALAASPTFAVMGLSTSMLGGGPTEMLCAATQQSPLSGMTAMYLLMSAFHAGVWLKLLRRSNGNWRGRGPSAAPRSAQLRAGAGRG